MFKNKTHIATLIILVLVLIVGGIGWYGARENAKTQAIKDAFPARFTEALDQGDFQGAYTLITAAAQRDPGSTELLFFQAMVTFSEAAASGDQARFMATARQIEATLNTFKDDGISSPDFHNFWGLTFLVQGKTDEALKHFRETLSLNPAYVPAIINIASVMESQQDYAQARQQYQNALDIISSNVTLPDAKRFMALASFGLARIAWFADQDKENAESLIAQALQQRPLPPNLAKEIAAFQGAIK
ncbi:MAG: tetratricopeptide repeat protein [Patescibacteria group bacterium]